MKIVYSDSEDTEFLQKHTQVHFVIIPVSVRIAVQQMNHENTLYYLLIVALIKIIQSLFHRRPTEKFCVFSCRPFIINATFSTGLVVSPVS